MSVRRIDRPSPNHGPRQGDVPVDILLLHYTDMATAETAVDRLCDPAAQVSAHYLVARDGRVFRLVPEERRAWHAGRAWWAGETDINSRSIGIELDNPGHSHGYTDFPEPQMTALVALCREILSRWPIPSHRVLGHSDVAPYRKIDPGHRFDWRRLAHDGVGAFPDSIEPATVEQEEAVRLLARIGYRVGAPSFADPISRAALEAFRRHWQPEELGRPFHRRGAGMLMAVTENAPCAHFSSKND